MEEASQTIYLWRKRSGQIGAWATGTPRLRAAVGGALAAQYLRRGRR